jgi:hypothetical protein
MRSNLYHHEMLIDSLQQEDLTLLKRYNLFKELFSFKMYEDLQDTDHEKLLLSQQYEQIHYHKLVIARSRLAGKCTRLKQLHSNSTIHKKPSTIGISADHSFRQPTVQCNSMYHTVQYSNANTTANADTTLKRRHAQRPHTAGVNRNDTITCRLQSLQQPSCELVTVQIGRNCNMNELRVRPVTASRAPCRTRSHVTTSMNKKVHSNVSQPRMLRALQHHVGKTVAHRAKTQTLRPHSAI